MYTITELHAKLTKKGVIKSSRPYLSRLASEGKLPYVEIDGKKMFKFKEVKKALAELNQKMPNGDKYNPVDKDGKVKTINSTKVFLQEYQGMNAKQKFDIEAGLLVYRDEVERKAFTVVRVLRDQLLAMPERITAEIMGSANVKEGKELFYKELNQVLEYLSSEKVLYE